MRRTLWSIIGVAIAFAAFESSTFAAWTRVQLASGAQMCQNENGDQIATQFTKKTQASSAGIVCAFLNAVGAKAEAQSLTIQGLVTKTTGSPNTPAPTLHSPWSQCDVGSPATAGSAVNGSGVLTVSGAGDVSNNNVLITHVAYQAVTGPIDFVTDIRALTGSAPYRKAGILFTAGNPCSAPGQWVAGSATGSSGLGVGFNLSNVVNGRSEKYYTAAGAQPPPQGLRLNYDGVIASFYFGSPGSWTLVDSETRSFTGTYYIAVFSSSGGPTNTELATATFDEPTITVPAGNAGSFTFVGCTSGTGDAQAVQEDAGTFQICATRGTGTSGAASFVVHNNATGSATGADWTTADLDQTLSWMSGEGGQKATTGIHVANRAGTQGDRTINVSMTSLSGAVAGAQTTQTITIRDAVSVTGHKFFPGHYVRAHTHNLSCGTGCDPTRHSLYTNFMTDPNVVGTEIWIDWKYLESDAGNNFAAGISWLTNELAFVASNYPGKKVGLMLNIAPYGPSALSQAGSWFPSYLSSAGCLYMEGSAGSGGGSDTINWFKNNATCLSYYTRLANAYGAAFDGNATLAFIRVQQETDDAINNVGISGAAEDTAWKNIAQASATAFPTTPIWIPVNWVGVETAANKESLLLYYKSIQVGAGNGDTQPKDLAYSCPSTAWVCVVMGLNASIGGTNHSNCGEFVSMGATELSEQGYNSVTDPFGGLTSLQVVNSVNNETCEQFHIWEPNFGEIGDPNTMYWNGTNGQKWAIDTHPITHTAKPSGFN